MKSFPKIKNKTGKAIPFPGGQVSPRAHSSSAKSPSAVLSSRIHFRPYQLEAFQNKSNGIEVWLWARQTGKSFTLAAWAVDRLLANPGRTVTILSNSKLNGIELNRKCADICRLLGKAFEQLDLSPDNRFESFNTETRIPIDGKVGRILVLAANPRTARGFSGDLILDEFAFHEDSAAIWDAAHPILSAHQDYLCRIASTPNGKHNMFYRLCASLGSPGSPGSSLASSAIPVRRVTITLAHAQGCQVFHPITRQPITPNEARALATNKRAYDQNFECAFEDESMALLTHELIAAAERPDVGFICEQNWTEAALDRLARCEGPLFAGVDVGRHRHWTVVTIVEKRGLSYLVRAILRMRETRLPDQQIQLDHALALPNVRTMKIDMTGLGLGLFEYTRQKFPAKVSGLNFSSSISSAPSSPSIQIRDPQSEIRNQSIRITEHLATLLLQTFEDRAIQHPIDSILRDDLRKPERLVGPTGRVSIAAATGGSGHADHFWSLALAIDAARSGENVPAFIKVIQRWKRPLFETRRRGLTM